MIALVPMKGNSERVPNKNMRDFNGFPLYHAILNTLRASKYIQKIVIDTDSESIKKDAIKTFGSDVMIIDRPSNLVGDFVSMNLIIDHDINQLDETHFIQTHSTNPLVTTATIDRACETYLNSLNEYDSLFAVTRLQTRLYNIHAKPVNHNPNELLRTQDLEPLFEENSNFYIFSKASFAEAGKNRIGIKSQIFEVNKLEAIDIDEVEDFILAELIHKSKGRL